MLPSILVVLIRVKGGMKEELHHYLSLQNYRTIHRTRLGLPSHLGTFHFVRGCRSDFAVSYMF